jgi:hypothetical protein
MDIANATYVGQQLKPFLCCGGLIVLLGCNIGNWKSLPSVASNLAAATGCTVIAAGGFAFGNFAGGQVHVDAVYTDPITGEKEGTLYENYPKTAPPVEYDSQNDRFYRTNPPK